MPNSAPKTINIVENYVSSCSDVLKFFGCSDNYFIKPLLDSKWSIKANDDFQILSYIDSNKKAADAVIVKKSGEPMIFAKDKYTLIVAIDCVKIAFIFENSNMI